MWDYISSLNTVKFSGVLAFAVVSAGIVYLYPVAKKLLNPQPPLTQLKRWVRVGSVSKIILYPIKSCAGIEVEQASATQLGLKCGSNALRDRIFMIVDYRYSFQTQRVLPRLGLIKVEVRDNQISVSGPESQPCVFSLPENILINKRSCRVFEDHVREVLDCGDAIGQWLDLFLEGTGYRLVYHALEKTQRARIPAELKFPQFMAQDKAGFQDQTAYMFMTEESIAYLNTLLRNPVTVRNFRPSILINGVSDPFGEDSWRFIRIGGRDGPVFKYSKPCTRCRLTTVNPDTAEFDAQGQPLETLLKSVMSRAKICKTSYLKFYYNTIWLQLETIEFNGFRLKRPYGDEVVDKLVEDRGCMGLSLGLYQPGANIKIGDPVFCAVL